MFGDRYTVGQKKEMVVEMTVMLVSLSDILALLV